MSGLLAQLDKLGYDSRRSCEHRTAAGPDGFRPVATSMHAVSELRDG
jgi:hypothetical protein